MTATTPSSQRPPAYLRGQFLTMRRLRAITYLLHVVVTLLALLSILTNRFDIWIDLRVLGGATATFVLILWTATVLLVPHTAGPRIISLAKPQWLHVGWFPRWTSILLLPTYFLIACLLADSVYFYELLRHNRIQAAVPIPFTLAPALLLSLWALFTREWLRVAERLPKTGEATRRTQFFAAAVIGPIAVFMLCFFLLHRYSRPPTEPVDLAVVLGNAVLPDGTASAVLEERTLAAVDLYKRGLVRHIMLSGAVWPAAKPHGPLLNEPTAMLQICVANGVPESDIFLDPIGVNTRATAFNAAKLMREHHYSTVVACTSPSHLFRTAMSFRAFGLDPYTVPSVQGDWTCAAPLATIREMAAIVVYTFDPHYREPKAMTMQLSSPRVVVTKSHGALEILDGDTVVKTYTCITGTNPGDKLVEGDRRTPIGHFRIVYKNPQSKFHLSLGLDYPAREDAERGLAAGLINQQQYNDILAALASDLTQEANQKKLWYTPLGGEIFIHGFAEGREDTAGCVSMSNPDIEELYAILPLGTPVEIRE